MMMIIISLPSFFKTKRIKSMLQTEHCDDVPNTHILHTFLKYKICYRRPLVPFSPIFIIIFITITTAAARWQHIPRLICSLVLQGETLAFFFLETQIFEKYFLHRSIFFLTNRCLRHLFVKIHFWFFLKKIQLVTAACWCRLTYIYHHFS